MRVLIVDGSQGRLPDGYSVSLRWVWLDLSSFYSFFWTMIQMMKVYVSLYIVLDVCSFRMREG